jgi:hypothetical protein
VVTIGRGSRQVIATDLNADGLIDVAAPHDIPNGSNAVIYYLQDAAMPGTFEPSRSISASDSNFSAAHDVATGLLDAQPGIDLAVASLRVNEVGTDRQVYAVWSQLLQTAASSGTFAHGGRYQLGFADETLIAVGDLNADGCDEVAVAARTRTSKNHNFVAVSLQNSHRRSQWRRTARHRCVEQRDPLLSAAQRRGGRVRARIGDCLPVIGSGSSEGGTCVES